MEQTQSIPEVVAHALHGLGIDNPAVAVSSILVRNGQFVGHRYGFDGGDALWLADTNTVRIYDKLGNPLTASTKQS
jgi:hypothetical protein